jgi:hypothetical protein
VRRQTVEQRFVTRAWIMLEAADGEDNADIGEHLGVAMNTVTKWRKPHLRKAGMTLENGNDRAGPDVSPPWRSRIKELACALPETSGMPLSRWRVQRSWSENWYRGRSSGHLGGHRIAGVAR